MATKNTKVLLTCPRCKGTGTIPSIHYPLRDTIAMRKQWIEEHPNIKKLTPIEIVEELHKAGLLSNKVPWQEVIFRGWFSEFNIFSHDELISFYNKHAKKPL